MLRRNSVKVFTFKVVLICWLFMLSNILTIFLLIEDINECMEELDDCSKLTHFCLNLRGSFMCKEKKFLNCLPGMLFDPDQRICAGVFC